jgi:hypothetical protein
MVGAHAQKCLSAMQSHARVRSKCLPRCEIGSIQERRSLARIRTLDQRNEELTPNKALQASRNSGAALAIAAP